MQCNNDNRRIRSIPSILLVLVNNVYKIYVINTEKERK